MGTKNHLSPKVLKTISKVVSSKITLYSCSRMITSQEVWRVDQWERKLESRKSLRRLSVILVKWWWPEIR